MLSLVFGAGPAHATLVAPQVHAEGVDPLTTAAFESVLLHELSQASPSRLADPKEAAGSRPCSDSGCAARLARRSKAEAALLCTLGRLGGKYVATLQCVDAAGRVAWSEQQTVERREDLDGAAARLAGSLPRHLRNGAPTSTTAADSALLAAAEMPRASWSTQGPRVGAISTLGESYAGIDQLLSITYVWRRLTPSFNVEIVPALGYAWGSDPSNGAKAREWTLFEMNVSWSPTAGDVSPYIGGGLGLHAVHLEHAAPGGPAEGILRADASSLALAVGGGVILFRNYDFQVACDLRYTQVFSRFDPVGGAGARGIAFSFGIMHR